MKYIILICSVFIIGFNPPPSPWFFVGIFLAMVYGTLKLVDENQAKQWRQQRDKIDQEN